MRAWGVLARSAALLVHSAACQVPPGGATPQIRKEWTLDRRVANDPEHRDGRIYDPLIAGYLQSLENTIATAAGAEAADVRLTYSSDRHASRLPGGVLYISAGLLESIENEAELAGLLAHELEHAPGESCVLASPLAPEAPHARELERRATATATNYLKAAGYDPAGLLDLLSKLAYEHPAWAKAVLPEDLLDLRAGTEPDALPPGEYRIDSSEFQRAEALLRAALERGAKPSDGDVNRRASARSR
jgi:hypothetical protein